MRRKESILGQLPETQTRWNGVVRDAGSNLDLLLATAPACLYPNPTIRIKGSSRSISRTTLPASRTVLQNPNKHLQLSYSRNTVVYSAVTSLLLIPLGGSELQSKWHIHVISSSLAATPSMHGGIMLLLASLFPGGSFISHRAHSICRRLVMAHSSYPLAVLEKDPRHG